MSPDVGRFVLALALALALAQTGLGVAATRGIAGAFKGAARAAWGGAGALLVAFLVLAAAFLGSDFSVANVAANSHADKPAIYKLAAAWGTHEGSMLLWCCVLALAAAALAADRKLAPAIAARAITVLGAVSCAFLAFTLFASSPFTRLAAPPLEGAGFNPLLQDPTVALHPPILYAGYVGLAAPFALAVAALWTGEADRAWAAAVRRWTLAAFTFLTLGVTLGAFWAYYELGWGGWWFWDPVENASFMPWLLAAALLHSSLVTERRGALPAWTALLAILAFGLSIFGTFLTRSGALTSVHAFALDPERGLILLGILGLAVGGALTLFGLRAGALARGDRSFAAVSRESALVINNQFLVSAAAVTLLGTTYPLIVEALGLAPASVGAPYFEATVAPMLGAVLLLAPLATLAPWRAARPMRVLARARIAIAAAVLVGAAFLILARGAPAGAAAAVALGVWLIAGAGIDGAQAIGLGRALKLPGATRAAAVLAHAGLGVFILGAAADAAFPIEAQALVQPGDRLAFDGKELVFERLERGDGPNYAADRAVVNVETAGRTIAVLKPERRYYPAGGQSTTEVAIRSGLLGDLYVALGPPQERADGSVAWTLRAQINPLIWAVFLGPVLIAIGAGTAFAGAWTQERRKSA